MKAVIEANKVELRALLDQWELLGASDDKTKDSLEELLIKVCEAGARFPHSSVRDSLQDLAVSISFSIKELSWASKFSWKLLNPRLKMPDSKAVLSNISNRQIGPDPIAPCIAQFDKAYLRVPDGKLFGRWEELEQLDGFAEDSETKIACFVGGGGFGKTALIHYWLFSLDRVRADSKNVPWEAVFAWSFHSGGTGAKQASGLEFFFDEARRYFLGEHDSEQGQGFLDQLANAVSNRRTLLVLDGIEPFQWGPLKRKGKKNSIEKNSATGGFRYPQLGKFLAKIAVSDHVFCVITTRIECHDLVEFPSVKHISVDGLATNDSVQLLKQFGLTGIDKDFRFAAEHVSGHPLSLSLLGGLIRDAGDGRVSRWQEFSMNPARRNAVEKISHWRSDRLSNESSTLDLNLRNHASLINRILKSYAEWLKSDWEKDYEFKVFCTLGFFHYPAKLKMLECVLVCLNFPPNESEQLSSALKSLERLGLIKVDVSGSEIFVHKHPLVQRGLANLAKKSLHESWEEVHSAIFDQYCTDESIPQSPVDIRDAIELYRAIAHGCMAGRFKEALDLVLKERLHGLETKRLSWSRLGAFSSELAALSFFYQNRDRVVLVDQLEPEDQAYILDATASCYRSLGNLDAAQKVSEKIKSLSARTEDEKLLLWMGRQYSFQAYVSWLKGNFRQSKQICEAALDRVSSLESSEAKERVYKYKMRLAIVLFFQGNLQKAGEKFRDAFEGVERTEYFIDCEEGFWFLEFARMQAVRRLYSNEPNNDPSDWQFVQDVLGVQDEFQDPQSNLNLRTAAISAFAREKLEPSIPDESPLETGLSQLANVRAHLATLRFGHGISIDLKKRLEGQLDESEDLIREANQLPFLPVTLLTCAEWYRRENQLEVAKMYALESLQVSSRASMKVFWADSNLELSRICFARGNVLDGEKFKAEASQLAASIGYKLCLWELERLAESRNALKNSR
jgi:tetratricopeptide (TPR) repeat protein